MIWLKLAWRNIWRNKSRTMIQLLVIAGSLAFIIWMQNISRGTYNKMIDDSVRMGSGNLSLHHRQYLEERLPELVIDVEEALKIIGKNDAIEAVLPRLNIAGLARSSHESAAAMVLGVDFAAEKIINPLLANRKIIAGEIPGDGQKNRAYLGSRLCETLRLKPGSKLVVMMQDFSGEITSKLFRVAGIFKSGVTQIDSSTIFVDRQELAASLGNINAVHDVAMVLYNRDDLPVEISRLQAACSQHADIRADTWEITTRQLADTIKMDHAQFKVIAFIFYMLVTFGTINLFLMSIMERTREFGLLRAMGLDRSRIRILIFCESILLGLVGVFAGLLLGSTFSFYTWHYGLDMSSMFENQEVAGMLFEPIIRSAWEWQWMVFLSGAMILVVILASIYPANKALRINPGEAMRSY